MKISEEEVGYIAKLAKLKLEDQEVKEIALEFENILAEFNSLNKLTLDKSDLSCDTELCKKSLREDISLDSDKTSLMSNVKAYRDGYIEVPKVIE